MRIKTIHIIKTWLTFVLLLLASKTLAAEVSLPTIPGAPKITENTLLPEFIVYIYYFAVVVSGFVAFAILLYGGIKYLTSGDSPAKKAEARGLLGGGLIGLLILLLAYLILNAINPQLTIFQTNIATPDLTIPAANYYGTIDLTKSTYQEVPLGTLIENVLDQDKIDNFKNFLEEVEKKSEKVLQKAEDLKKETENCSCTNTMTWASCTLQVNTCSLNAGSCTGEPCDRMALEQKKQDLKDAFTDLKNFVEPKIDSLQAYLEDISALYYGSLLMKEGLFPIPYEQIIELEQLSLNYTGATIDFIPLRFGIKEIRATGYDPMNFYFDYITNKEIFEDIHFNDLGLYITVPPSVTNPNIPNNPPVSPSNAGLINPLPNSCNSGGWESYPGHKGIDLADGCPTNSPVVAAADGEVIKINTGCPENPLNASDMRCGGGWGNYIEIWHPQLNILTRYAHLKSVQAGLKVGDWVKQGDQIGREDTTGRTFGYCPGPGGEHLHFEVQDVNGNRIPPEPWLPYIPPC